ncbi:uncharacterized protein [Montipora foliosa]|uniref:uncharacterized protein n=1 Tax=Montipora foliosa TaxID=591990 RepID=UPI0035F1AC92
MAKIEASLVVISVCSSFLVGSVLASSISGLFVKETRSDKPLSSSLSWDSEAGSCLTLNCSLAVNASEAAKFQSLMVNAIAIFMFVTVGNKTGVGGNYSEPQKWAWLRNQRGRFLATLPYDFDILSLTTLTRETFSVDLNITSTPAECFANLPGNCLLNLIAETIVDNLTGLVGSVCTRRENFKDWDKLKGGGYECCERKSNSSFICDEAIEDNPLVETAILLLRASSIVFGLFAPLLFKYLPKGLKRGPKLRSRAVFSRTESEMSDSGASVLDMMALNSRQVLFALDGGIVDILREQTESVFLSRLCRCLFVILLSFLPLLQGFIYVHMKKEEAEIYKEKLHAVGDVFITIIEKGGQVALGLAYCFCIALICIAIAIPRTLPDFARRLSGRKDERTFLGFMKPEGLVASSDQRGFQLMYENMVFHLNCLLKVKFWKFLFLIVTYPLQKLCGLDVFEEDADFGSNADTSENGSGYELCSKICTGVLLLLFFPLWAVLITTAILLYIFPVSYVALRIWKMLFRIEVQSPCCDSIPSFIKITSFPILYVMFIIFCICVEASYFMLAVAFTLNIMFLGRVTGFTIMGLLFYIDVYLPYIVLGVWVVIYSIRGVNKYYAQFTKLKTTVFEECENYDNITKTEANIRDTFRGPIAGDRRTTSMSSLSRSNFLVSVDEYGVPSIPLDIFLASSHQLMPFKRIFLAKLLKVIALGSYLVVLFLFVMSLTEYNAASTVVQALAVFLLGGLPLFAFQNSNHISQAEEIRAKSYVKDFIKQYAKRTL